MFPTVIGRPKYGNIMPDVKDYSILMKELSRMQSNIINFKKADIMIDTIVTDALRIYTRKVTRKMYVLLEGFDKEIREKDLSLVGSSIVKLTKDLSEAIKGSGDSTIKEITEDYKLNVG